MADDNTFRQERKKEKIDPSEIMGNMQDKQISFDDVMAVQKSAGVDSPRGADDQQQSVNQQSNVRPVEGVSVSGNLPPQMQQMMQQRLKEVDSANSGIQNERDNSFQQSQFNHPMQQQAMQTNNPLQSQFGTNDPNLNALIASLTTQNYEKIYLPSRGKFYTTPDLPQNGELHVRPMTGQEEAIISSVRHMRKGGIDMIFSNCVRENINPGKLLIVDRVYMLIYLRAISYGNLYEVALKCPECNSQFDYDIDLNLPIDYCPENFTKDNLTKVLPKSGFQFKYRLATGEDDIEMEQYRERRSKIANAVNDSFFHKASILIEEIGNGQATITNKYGIKALLEKLPSRDVNYIRNLLNDPPFGVETEVDIMCQNCVAEFKVELPFEVNFFFPREKTE